jgi:hypothetical protein
LDTSLREESLRFRDVAETERAHDCERCVSMSRSNFYLNANDFAWRDDTSVRWTHDRSSAVRSVTRVRGLTLVRFRRRTADNRNRSLNCADVFICPNFGCFALLGCSRLSIGRC